jgi:LL-diaminopimelate aminotransferase
MKPLPLARRLAAIPPYPFDELDRRKQAALAAGRDIVDLGIGDPDLPTPPAIREALADGAARPVNHRYPPYRGTASFREAAARYLKKRFGVTVDPLHEVLALIGSKEGIAHLPLALVNPEDVVLVPDPGYPVYAVSARFVGAEVHPMPLRREHGFLPRFDDIPTDVARRAVLLWLNYPNNPTGAVAPLGFYEEVAEFARTYGIAVAWDAAYAEMVLDGPLPPSALAFPKLRERVIEFHSLSKTFNMTGWRLGFATGAAGLIGALGSIKTNVDSGVFGAIQDAGAAALDGLLDDVNELRAVYRRRRKLLVDGLRRAGLDHVETPATFYVVAAVPVSHTALSFASEVLERAGIVCLPCTAFGAAGEGFVRFSLTAPDNRVEEAGRRLAVLAHP